MGMLRRWPVAVATLYCIGGILTWVHFLNGADGLGNLGLQMYVMPLSMAVGFVGRLFGASEFPFVTKVLGETAGNAVFYFPSLAVLTWLLGWRGPELYRKMMEKA